MPAAQAPTNFATATRRASSPRRSTTLAGDGAGRRRGRRPLVAGAAPWVRPFAVDLDDRPRRRRRSGAEAERHAGRCSPPADHPLAEPLRQALERGRASAAACCVCLPRGLRRGSTLELALLRRAGGARRHGRHRFVAGPARPRRGRRWPRRCTWRRRTLRTTIVHVAGDGRTAVEPGRRRGGRHRRLRRGRATTTDGVRRVPTLRAAAGRGRPGRAAAARTRTTCCWSPAAARASPPSARWRWRRDTRRPAGRCSAAPTRPRTRSWRPTWTGSRRPGSTLRYARADVTDADAGPGARSPRSPRTLGPVTAVLHGAGRNEPAALASLDEDGVPRDARAEDRRPARRCSPPSTRTRLRLLVTLRQHHRPGRAARRGALRDGQRVAGRPDRASRRGRTRHAGRSAWSGRSGPASGMGERLGVRRVADPRRASRRSPPDAGHRDAAPAARRPGRAAGWS